MAIRKILVLGGPREKVLRTKAKKISRFDTYLERLIEDMWETMREAPGVGLAAPQIGESIRVLVAEYEDEHVALVNPEILHAEGEELGTEGCLSIPGLLGDNVPRATTILVKARNPKGKEIKVRAEGWFARILQHEIDHLDGVLYTDRISPRDIREVTEEDIAEEGAPQEPRAARAKSPAKTASDSAQRESAAKTATPPAPSVGAGEKGESAAKTANGKSGEAESPAKTATGPGLAAGLQPADRPQRESPAKTADRDDASPSPDPAVSSASSVVSSSASPAKTATPSSHPLPTSGRGSGGEVQGGRQ